MEQSCLTLFHSLSIKDEGLKHSLRLDLIDLRVSNYIIGVNSKLQMTETICANFAGCIFLSELILQGQ